MCVVVLHRCAVTDSTTSLIRLRLNVHLALRGPQALPRLNPKPGEPSMIEWNVYADGCYVGTVHAVTEDAARLAALSRYEIAEDAGLSVSRR